MLPTCFICMERLTSPRLCIKCSKMACQSCLDSWNQPSCPHCRQVSQFIKCPFYDDLPQDYCHHMAPFTYFCITCSVCCCAECILSEHIHHEHTKLGPQVLASKDKLSDAYNDVLNAQLMYNSLREDALELQQLSIDIQNTLKELPSEVMRQVPALLERHHSLTRITNVIPKQSFTIYSTLDPLSLIVLNCLKRPNTNTAVVKRKDKVAPNAIPNRRIASSHFSLAIDGSTNSTANMML